MSGNNLLQVRLKAISILVLAFYNLILISSVLVVLSHIGCLWITSVFVESI